MSASKTPLMVRLTQHRSRYSVGDRRIADADLVISSDGVVLKSLDEMEGRRATATEMKNAREINPMVGQATIEERPPGKEWILSAPGGPVVVSKERVVLPCGCCAYAGLRVDTREVCLVATECEPEHRVMRDRFYDLMKESLENPTNRRLIDVAQELFDKANSEREAGLL